ncbi:putative histone-lysine N-methyltransferase [Arabidopsis thaliana]|uniref:Uncharacterized protein n=4 Tax=Arabidopsis TaxID=3701 RepID=A0A384KTK0_ARATH|nr:PHD finger protein [Arabidopsis thaliana]KAG7629345.1 Zinc finger FYVE/PHD-type [Arabidopsis thaliana x Arabidopsis arenosa]KAG7635267.1 Zinc finger FYVE/PHD-type [Arabidopsis suecica]AEE80248.1 PHD finger protein [Arabidopsis thaliana]OAP07052.1 hypothetical protein AXX17_AT3G56020 [Arabidopsis thaliana]CAA0387913.1 unnamed protein product [Arabidopsis thaliana]|eukprot:NP_001118880.1 PHD finger protein [Arabidopsis thaliana]
MYYVCCDGRNVWVHAGCDIITNERFKELEHNNYYCPDCKVLESLFPDTTRSGCTPLWIRNAAAKRGSREDRSR